MNTKLVNTAAGVINAALTQNRTAAGIALALDSAQLLLTPETTAELVRLRERVAELEQQSAVRALTDEADDDCSHPNGYGPNGCAGCGAFAPADFGDDVRPQVTKLRALLAGQRAAVDDDPFHLHHTYVLGRELPETGGDVR